MRGVDILLMANTGTDAAPVWTAVGGQRNATLTEESETIDITSKDSAGATESDYGLYSWSVSADGVYTPNEAAYVALQNAMRNKTKIKVRIRENGVDALEGLALVTSRELDAPYDGEVTYSLELTGTGTLTAL